MKNQSPRDRVPLSQEFRRLSEVCRAEQVTYLTLLKALRVRGHSLITLFFALPFLLPIPVPGLSILFGLVIGYAGMRICFGQKPWLPRSWLRKPVPTGIVIKIFQAGEKLMRPVEKLVRPRGRLFSKHPWTTSLTGLLIAILGFFLALPLPPGTNFPPAVAIVLLSIGLLEEDGLFLSLGYVTFLLNVAFFGALPVLGYEGIKRLLRIF